MFDSKILLQKDFDSNRDMPSVRSGISWVRISPEECAHVWCMDAICSFPTLRPKVRQAPGPVRCGVQDPFGKLRARQAQGRLLGALWLFFNYRRGVKRSRVENDASDQLSVVSALPKGVLPQHMAESYPRS